MLWMLLACAGEGTGPGGRETAAADSAVDSAGGDSAEDTGPDQVYGPGEGPHAVSVEGRTIGGSAVNVYTPEGEGPWPVVTWSHGAFRHKEQHASAAARAASWGFIVGAADLPEGFDHEANGEYLADELVPALLAEPTAGAGVAMVGHSAGGLASIVGAARGGADVWVGLDAVDANRLGAGVDQDFGGDALLLHGEPGVCNANGDGSEWQTGGRQWTVRVVGAGHCDFESDTDGLCTNVCGAQDAARLELVTVYAIGFLVDRLGGGAAAYVEGGETAAADQAAGRLDY
jgi:hypothetical protein